MWFISELNEVISVSDLFRCPIVFILLCDLGRDVGQRKLTTNGHFFFSSGFGLCVPITQD